MDLFTWPWQVAGQTLVCSALGVWASYRLERSPARAHAALLLGLAAAVLTPLASFVVTALGGGLLEGPPPAMVYRLANAESNPRASPALRGVTAGVLAAWAAVAAGHLAGVAVAFSRGGRLVACSAEVQEPRLLAALAAARTTVGPRREVRLRSSAEVAGPMVWVWGATPVVLIPDEAASRSEGIDWEAVFVHELTHVARRDHLAGLFATAVAACLFWNPVVWWARRRLERASEYACDDRVAAEKSPVDYALSLLALRREALIGEIPAPALTGRRNNLKARIRRLLEGGSRGGQVGPWWVGAAMGFTALVVLALAVAQASPGPRPEEPPGNLLVARPPDRP